MKTNIIITKREESGNGIRYCEVKGTKWFNRCALPEHRKLQKGDVFNVYRREYETDSEGNITRWTCDRKYGCEYNGRSIVSSLETFDKELDEYYTTGAGRYNPYKPLAQSRTLESVGDIKDEPFFSPGTRYRCIKAVDRAFTVGNIYEQCSDPTRWHGYLRNDKGEMHCWPQIDEIAHSAGLFDMKPEDADPRLFFEPVAA